MKTIDEQREQLKQYEATLREQGCLPRSVQVEEVWQRNGETWAILRWPGTPDEFWALKERSGWTRITSTPSMSMAELDCDIANSRVRELLIELAVAERKLRWYRRREAGRRRRAKR